MSKPGKDSPEVAAFITLFARLKLYTDDDPDGLFGFAQQDSSVRELCSELSFAAHVLRKTARRSRLPYAAPVDPSFIKAWRDYEERYERAVAGAWLADLLPGIEEIEAPLGPKTDLEWESADFEAKEEAAALSAAMNFAYENADDQSRWGGQEDFIEHVLDGVTAWEQLAEDIGFDLRGVLRRRALVPFVLVPRQVSAKHGNAEPPSMLRNLQQAHDAFVFGATYAALALMRSIMEAVLRDHYQIQGKDLSERIRNARDHLPPGVNQAALHRLRKLANSILHLDQERDVGPVLADPMRLEKEIVSLLFGLRALIEGGR